jgi:hypothetical protein
MSASSSRLSPLYIGDARVAGDGGRRQGREGVVGGGGLGEGENGEMVRGGGIGRERNE